MAFWLLDVYTMIETKSVINTLIVISPSSVLDS